MVRPFSYRAGPDNLGVGVENLALVSNGRPNEASFYSPRYDVRREMKPYIPVLPNIGQSLPAADLRQNGVYLSGDMALAQLVEAYYKKG